MYVNFIIIHVSHMLQIYVLLVLKIVFLIKICVSAIIIQSLYVFQIALSVILHKFVYYVIMDMF
jgi:hypothetical protein